MSEPMVVVVARPVSALPCSTYGECTALGLRFAGHGYETTEVWSADEDIGIPNNGDWRTEEETETLYGIIVVRTWNGAFKWADPRFQTALQGAHKMFKTITGIDGEVYVIGEQV